MEGPQGGEVLFGMGKGRSAVVQISLTGNECANVSLLTLRLPSPAPLLSAKIKEENTCTLLSRLSHPSKLSLHPSSVT